MRKSVKNKGSAAPARASGARRGPGRFPCVRSREDIHVLSRRSFVALLVSGLLVLPAVGQDKKDTKKKPDDKSEAVTLKWAFGDKPYYQEITTTTEQNMTVNGMKINQKQSQTFFFSWKKKDTKPNGNVVVTQTIEGVKMDIQIGNNPIQFDSTNPAATANTPLTEFFKALIGTTFELELNPKSDKPVVSIKGRDEFITKLKGANPGLEPLLKTILSDEALKQMADPVFAVAPNKPVKKTEHWTSELKLNMGPIGTYETTYTYTYEGKDGKNDKISQTADVKYVPPTDSGAGPATLPFKIKKADLKTKEAKGTVLFDNQKGRVASSDMSLALAGTLTIEINGMSTDVQLDQTQKTTVKTMDTNPVPPPKK
jgi:hypothetical protein